MWSWLAAHITSILGFLTSLISFVVLFIRVQKVHVLVNSNLNKVLDKLGIEKDRSTQLADTLKDAGVEVPPKAEDVK